MYSNFNIGTWDNTHKYFLDKHDTYDFLFRFPFDKSWLKYCTEVIKNKNEVLNKIVKVKKKYELI